MGHAHTVAHQLCMLAPLPGDRRQLSVMINPEDFALSNEIYVHVKYIEFEFLVAFSGCYI